MRTGLAAAALAGFLLAVALAAGQSQPFAPPDAAGHTERTDLAEPGQLAGAKRVLRFVQVSDAHILDDDAPYPLRQEPLDPYIEAFSASAQRPQDEYTDEVLESIVRAINAQHQDDPFQFIINTGDNIDNDLENELMRFIDLWDGTSTTRGPVSDLACVPDGQSTDLADTSHDVTDQCTSLPESLLAPRTALAADLPWYSAFGNHDTLIQGNVNPNEEFDEVAARHGRHLLTQPEYVAMHFGGGSYACDGPGGHVESATVDNDMGHGYGWADTRLCDENPDNDGYYAFDRNGVRFIVLDTLNDDFVTANSQFQGLFNPQSVAGADVIGGYAEGAVDPAQLEWLRAEVAANQDKLVVVFSHHTVNSMFTNLGSASCAPGVGCLSDLLAQGGYATGEQLIDELSAQPNVVAWLGGHTHRNRIEPKGAEAFGFWNIESSSLIDYPQQARIVELWVTADKAKGFWLLENFTHDFELSRELELTDPQRVPEAIGAPGDQDTILWFDVPGGVSLTPQPAPKKLWLNEEGNRGFLQPGQTYRFGIAVLENNTFLGVPGLNATWGVGHHASDGTFVVDVTNGTPMSEVQNGVYEAFFRPTANARHLAFVEVSGISYETLRSTLVLQPMFSDDADPCGKMPVLTSCVFPPTRDSPPLPTAAVLGLAFALLLARRR